MKKENFLIIDGNLLMFQSFYATYNPYNSYVMTSNKGVTTNGTFQFFTTLINLLEELKPKYLFIAFDAKGKTKRHEEYPDYKAGRTKAPEIIYEQFESVKKLLTLLKINHNEIVGAEADDLIATVSKINEVSKYIYSKDQDLLQLVKEDISIIYKNPETKKFATVNKDNFYDIYNFYPNQIPDYKAINGDTSDNLPGVKGIGKIGAIKLLEQFGSIHNVYDNIDKLTLKMQEKLLNSKEMSLLCYKLACLNNNVSDLQLDKNLYLYNIDIENAKDYFIELDLLRVFLRLENLKW
ncbi:5'-3' exonuclease [Mycoplasma crocodyli]|uniref:5'-3' exonuclease n=1 Tax=Mycoplasma crocodyli (strain ATCC 51981 / MP145) TaxID=512564 RepID=D5E5Y1_MYCCM|nr:5'-3' exonuclease [Mycoplasma crocodyli]ADE19485.1 probable 5'-3' exodeoxyribonuclease [Mycoplasma crocodyli MP145]